MTLLDRLAHHVLGPAPWSAEHITDEWFRAHFNYATDVVNHWLGSVLDLRTAHLLNFGCGDGITDLGLVLRYGATSIHGIDIRQEYDKLRRIAREQLGMRRLPPGLRFETIRPATPLAGRIQADGIFSWSTFEHVHKDQLLPIARDLHAALKPGGFFFLQIEPLYYSAYGSHLRRYNEMPWHHLLSSDDALWAQIQAHEGPIDGAERDFGFDDFGPDGYKKFVFNEYLALNRLTADEVVALMTSAGFKLVRQERRQMEIEVPTALHGRYREEDLRTNEIFLLLGK